MFVASVPADGVGTVTVPVNVGDASGAFSARSVSSAIVPSLSWKVYVRAAVFEFVKKLVNVFSAFLKFILNNVSPAYPPVASFPLVSCFRFSAVCCAVETGLFASLVLSAFPRPTCVFVTLCGFVVVFCECV